MSQLPPQGFALPQQSGVGGFPQAPALSRDNPGQLVPARPGFLPGALPGRGGDGAYQGAKLGRGTVPASAAAQANLSNGLPFGMGGSPPAPGPPAEGLYTSADMQAAAMPVDAPAIQAAATQSAAAMQPAAPSAAAMHPAAAAPAPSEVAPPPMLAGFAPAAPPSAATPAPPPMLSGFAPAAPPLASQPPHAFAQVAPPAVVQPPGLVSAPPAGVSSPPMVTPAMGAAAIGIPAESSARDHGVEPPARIGGEDPGRSNGAIGPGEVAIATAPGDPSGAVSPWMLEKSAPPPPVFTPSTPVESAKPVAPPKPTSKAPFMAVFALLVVGGIAFAAYHFRAQLAFDGASKKTDEGALKVAAPTETTASSSDDKTPSTPMSARPPPQLATGLTPPPLPPSTGAPNPLPGPKPGPPKPPPTAAPASGGKFDPQGI